MQEQTYNTPDHAISQSDAQQPGKQPSLLHFNPQAMQGLTESDRFLFEYFGQGTVVEPAFKCIHHAIQHFAKQQPYTIAARYLNDSLTYFELDSLSDQLAAKLWQKGVRHGDHVAVFMRRSTEFLVSILACMKLGAAYVPMDARIAPASQMAYVMEVANIRHVLSLTSCLAQLPAEAHQVVAVDDFMRAVRQQGVLTTKVPLNQLYQVTPDDVCFVLFTSGTTGKPNGVKVTHRNLCNILLTEPGNLGMKPGLNVSQILNIAFDMSAWEILGCLANGATLLIRSSSISETVEQADIVIATPSVLAGVDPQRARCVKTVAVAGEPCPRNLADKWAEFCNFYNSCGPTETTIINTAQLHQPQAEQLSIGTPTPNNTVYVLDEHLKPCAIGEVGEMWAGGDCVSAGYLANPELTAERYRPDPFLGNGHTMFRTRDLGRWTKTGQLEHLGRTDDQVKVRGFRVELDSVSGILETMAACRRAVTMKLNSRDLIAFVDGAELDTAQALRLIGERLPYYCVPRYLIKLDALPLTSRGKVDKRMLMENVDYYINRTGQPGVSA